MLNLMPLEPGVKLKLRNGAVAEIVENMDDGIWLQLRLVSVRGGDGAVGDEELVHCEEIVGLADEA